MRWGWGGSGQGIIKGSLSSNTAQPQLLLLSFGNHEDNVFFPSHVGFRVTIDSRVFKHAYPVTLTDIILRYNLTFKQNPVDY